MTDPSIENLTECTMGSKWINAFVCFGLLASTHALAGEQQAMIASAESAGPAVVTSKATIKAPEIVAMPPVITVISSERVRLSR